VTETRFARWAISATLGGGFLFGYHAAVVAGALLSIRGDFRLSNFEQDVFVSLLPLGATFGSLLNGRGSRTVWDGADADPRRRRLSSSPGSPLSAVTCARPNSGRRPRPAPRYSALARRQPLWHETPRAGELRLWCARRAPPPLFT
jgi:hypothetical protein